MAITREVVYVGADVNRRTEKLRQIRAATEALSGIGLPEDIEMEGYENHELSHIIFSRNGLSSHIEAGRKVDEEGTVVGWYLQHLHAPEEIPKLTGVQAMRESIAPILIKTEKSVSPLSSKDLEDFRAGFGMMIIQKILKILD
jgi:hypothetical protein